MDIDNNDIETIVAPTPFFLDSTHPEYVPEKVVSRGYLYLYESFVYTPGIMSMRVERSAERILNWILWIEIPVKYFIEMTDKISNGGGQIEGLVYSPIFNYEEQKEVRVKLNFDTESIEIKLPTIIPVESDSRLSKDFISGLDINEFISIQRKLKG